MATQIFINLPVKDLDASVNFFTWLGYRFNPQFTNEQGTCMIISEQIFVMLLVEPFFKTFIKKEIADSRRSTEVILCISAESRNAVDELIGKVVEAGGTLPNPAQDQGFMYSHGFEDLDGHLWEVMYMAEQAPSEAQAN